MYVLPLPSCFSPASSVQREQLGLSPTVVDSPSSSSAIFMEDYESVVTTTPWKVRTTSCSTSDEGS